MKRRTFIKTLGAAGGAALLSPEFIHTAVSAPRMANPDPILQDLIDAALRLGAAYADARYVFVQNQSMQTRRDQLYSLNDLESGGFSLRVHMNGNWGFAAQGTHETIDAKHLAASACSMASAHGAYQEIPLITADRLSVRAPAWRSAFETDPFTVGIKEKLDFLLELSIRPLKTQDIAYSVANFFSARRESRYVNSLDGAVEQLQVSVYPNFAVTTFDSSTRRMDSRTGRLEAMSGGFETCLRYPFADEIDHAVQELLQHSQAEKLNTGEYDLVIEPSHLWRILYESLGPSLDPMALSGLDGASPRNAPFSISDLGRKLFEAPMLNIDFDNTVEGGLATCGWDDGGHAAAKGTLIQEGTLANLPRADEFATGGTAEGTAVTRSSGWQTPPRFSMPNLVLRASKDGMSLEDMVASTERGLLLSGRGKPAVSANRKWLQGQSQVAWLIENGKRGKMVRDFQYNTSILYFWSVLGDVGSTAERMVAGDLFPQSTNPNWEAPFSVAVPPARFRNVTVVAAGQESTR